MSIQRLKSHSKDFTISERIIPRFTGIFIPSEVLEIEDISLMEMLLLSWIDALYDKEHGGCFASNEYLAKKLKVKENSIAKSLTNLRKLFLIEDVSFDGRKRVIRSKLASYIEFCQSNAGLEKNPMLDWKKIQAGLEKNPMLPSATPIYDSKEKEKKREGVSPQTPPSPLAQDLSSFHFKELKKIKEDLIEPDLKKWTKQYEAILKTKGVTPERIKKALILGFKDEFQVKNCINPKRFFNNIDSIELSRDVTGSKSKKTVPADEVSRRRMNAFHEKASIERCGNYTYTDSGIKINETNEIIRYNDPEYSNIKQKMRIY